MNFFSLKKVFRVVRAHLKKLALFELYFSTVVNKHFFILTTVSTVEYFGKSAPCGVRWRLIFCCARWQALSGIQKKN